VQDSIDRCYQPASEEVVTQHQTGLHAVASASAPLHHSTIVSPSRGQHRQAKKAQRHMSYAIYTACAAAKRAEVVLYISESSQARRIVPLLPRNMAAKTCLADLKRGKSQVTIPPQHMSRCQMHVANHQSVAANGKGQARS
jgi:hypothetical protein